MNYLNFRNNNKKDYLPLYVEKTKEQNELEENTIEESNKILSASIFLTCIGTSTLIFLYLYGYGTNVP